MLGSPPKMKPKNVLKVQPHKFGSGILFPSIVNVITMHVKYFRKEKLGQLFPADYTAAGQETPWQIIQALYGS